MDIKIYKRDNYNFVCSNNSSFKADRIRICFTKKFDKKDMVYMGLLRSILNHSTKKYNTIEKKSKRIEELYMPTIDISYMRKGNNGSIEVNISFINPKYTSFDMYEKTFNFLYEIIFNPNVNSNQFDNQTFEIIKKQLILSIESIREDGGVYGSFLSDEIIYENTPLAYNLLNLLDDIKKVTSKDLYEYYLHYLDNSICDVVCIGNNDEDILIKHVDKLLKGFTSFNHLKPFYVNLEYRDAIIENKKTIINNQSSLFASFVCENLTQYEKDYVLPLFNFIFGSMNDAMLFKIIREEYNICYSIYSYLHRYSNVMVVEAGINYKNYDNCVVLIKKIFGDMSNKANISNLINKAKTSINQYLNEFYSNPNRILNYLYNIQYEDIDDIDCQMDKFNSVTIEDIVNLSSKIHLYSIFLLEGRDSNEEVQL